MMPKGKLMGVVLPIDPVIVPKGARIIQKYIELGVYKFADIIREAYAVFVEQLRAMFPILQKSYLPTMSDVSEAVLGQVDNG